MKTNYVTLKRSLELTDLDLLWLARAYRGEHGMYTRKRFQTFAWCMINRFCLYPGTRHWPSFVYMLRHFCQPINPRWMRGGDLALKHKGSRAVTEKRLKRREKYCAMTWKQLSGRLQKACVELSKGLIEPPPECFNEGVKKITNFASTTKSRKRKHPMGFDCAGNWYFEDRVIGGDIVTIVVDHW